MSEQDAPLHPERLELNRSAGGAYYWKVVVAGPILEATAQAMASDELLRAAYDAHGLPHLARGETFTVERTE